MANNKREKTSDIPEKCSECKTEEQYLYEWDGKWYCLICFCRNSHLTPSDYMANNPNWREDLIEKTWICQECRKEKPCIVFDTDVTPAGCPCFVTEELGDQTDNWTSPKWKMIPPEFVIEYSDKVIVLHLEKIPKKENDN